jgi:[acyl-carrier-protein] S-malonyltransferase
VRVGDGAAVSNATQPAALFPGQGSHTPEMRELVARRAPELLDRVTELVGEDPFARVEENTRFAQPAIFCASLAGWDALDLHPSAAAGHSLGELAALTAAGVLKRDDALELVVLRGRLMGEARNGSMLALVGASLEDAEAIAREGGVVVANDNAPGQVVLSGSLDALDRTEQVASERGTRVIRLDVAGAFHSPAMAPAVEPFRAALDEVEIAEPAFPVFSCASAAPFSEVRAELADALTSPVRWRETVIAMHEAGAPSFVEVGPGKVLARMGKRILKGVPFETPAEGLIHA